VDNIESVIFTFIIVLALDLMVAAAKESLLHTFLLRFYPQREQMEPGFRPTLELFHSIPRLQTSLDLIKSLTRFLAAGLASYWSYLFFAGSIVHIMGTAILVSIFVFWCEWLVEQSVSGRVDVWAVRMTPFARLLVFLMTPLVVFPLWLSKALNLFPEDDRQVTEEELKTLVDAGQQGGILEQGVSHLKNRIDHFPLTLAREVMVPRTDMLSLEVATPLDQAIDSLLAAGHSRVPVYEENVDHIIGLLYSKDLLRIWRAGNHLQSLRSLLRPAYFVPEAIKIDVLLREMQKKRIHMAIVVDEYGGISGLVTLEDIVEEVVGEIRDEFDQGEELLSQKVGEGEYMFLGRIDLDDFNEIMGSHIPKDETDTLGGYIYKRLGRVPANGASIQVGYVLLTVEEVEGRRIRKVRAKLIANTPDEEEENTDDNG